jgi:hypothetical protein
VQVEETGQNTLEIPVWYKAGGMMLRRDALDPDHPGSTFSYLQSIGLNPRDYGVPGDRPYCMVGEEEDSMNEKLIVSEQKRQRLVDALTPSAITKSAYMGEILDPETKRQVSWTAIKMIMKMITDHAKEEITG